MSKTYFIPTAKYKKYLVLDIINKNSDLTQREIASLASISLSMVNQYLTDYETDGYIVKEYITKKSVKYLLTDKGLEYMKVLNIGYLSETQNLYNKAKEEIMKFINRIIKNGHKDIILYGAGEVAEIILATINSDNSIPLSVIAVVDDDKNKQGMLFHNSSIKSIDYINEVKHDCVIIGSYTNYEIMMDKLLDLGYSKDKIEYFFK
jgi:predicted transcriptional regulator